MIFSGEIPALQLAIIETMLNMFPDKREEILKKSEFYRKNFFVDNGEVISTTKAALEYMKNVNSLSSPREGS